MIHLSHILFEPVILKENFLSKLNAQVKVIFCLSLLILNLILPNNIFQTGLLVFYIVVSLSWKVRWRYIIGRLIIAILISIILTLSELADLHLALVILAGVSVLSLLSFSTAMEDIFSALSKLKFPKLLLEIAFLMYKYIFIFFEEVETIYHAQVARLGYQGFKRSINSLGILIGMLMIRSFQQAEICYEAILSRGYKDRLFY